MRRIEMPQRQILICHLVEEMRNKKSWAGHTHIQKCVLFLQELFQIPTGYEFVLHLHGPYSFELRNDLTLMRTRSQLDVEERPGYGPSFTIGARGKLTLKTASPHSKSIEFDRVVEALLRSSLGTTFGFLNVYPQRSTCRRSFLL